MFYIDFPTPDFSNCVSGVVLGRGDFSGGKARSAHRYNSEKDGGTTETSWNHCEEH